jgi:hypothetical protein
MYSILPVLLATFAAVSAGPIRVRVVAELNQDAVKEAQPRDDTATRAFSDATITVSLPITNLNAVLTFSGLRMENVFQ